MEAAAAAKEGRAGLGGEGREKGVEGEEGGLPPGWEAVEDDSGRTYFWNARTDETRWDRPGEQA